MMECAKVEVLVRTWESGGLPEAESLAAARTHARGCAACAPRFDAILALIGRDVEGASALPAAVLPAGYADRVLGRIESRRHSSISSRGLVLAAAAALALFLVGAGFGSRVLAPQRRNTVSVLFVLNAPSAKTVSLVGDFNKWNPAVHELRRKDPGQPWELRVELPKGKMYVYDFVIDGVRWVPDPSVEAKVDDGFGGSGSLLRL
ncbi:MAG TPA: isoamylase early set domain-containing protein [Rectinemataceae bacterium]|nr:isoamylase early set domain-containing protein [Rectinemataceae bacterium]